MGNLTAVESLDGVYEITTEDPLKGFDPAHPEDGIGLSNYQGQNLLNRTEWLKKRIGIQGSWDMTPGSVSAPCAVDATRTLACTYDATDPHAVAITPTDPATAAFGGVYMLMQGATANALDGNPQQVGMVVPAVTGGDNVVLSFFLIANSGASIADIIASLAGASPTGTCAFGILVFDESNTAFEEGFLHSGMAFHTASLSAAPGDHFYVSVHTGTGEISCGVNAGGLVDVGGAVPLGDLPGGETLRVYACMAFSAATPVFGAAPLVVDFSSSDNAREGFGGTAVTDPVVPAGADDSKIYLVSNPGPYAGTTAKAGDLVMFYDALASIFVFRPPVNYTDFLTAADFDAHFATDLATALGMGGAIATFLADALSGAEAGPIADAIAAALTSAEGGAIATAISDAVAVETGRAEAAETVLQSNIDAEAARAEAAESSMTSAIADFALSVGYTKEAFPLSITIVAPTHRYAYSMDSTLASTGVVQISGAVLPTDGDVIEILGGADRAALGMRHLTVEFLNAPGGPVMIDDSAPVADVSSAVFELCSGKLSFIYNAAATNWKPVFYGDAGHAQNGAGTPFSYPGLNIPNTGDTVTAVGDAPMMVVSPVADIATLTLQLAQVRLRQSFKVAFTKAVAALTILNGDGSAFSGAAPGAIVAASGILPVAVVAGDMLEFYAPDGSATAGCATVFYIGKINYAV